MRILTIAALLSLAACSTVQTDSNVVDSATVSADTVTVRPDSTFVPDTIKPDTTR